MLFLKRLLDDKPLNFATIGYIFDIEPKTIYYWYRNLLSGFVEETNTGIFHKNDQKHCDGSTLPVPILKPENIGASMVIDEKVVNDEIYTILSNRSDGRIALLAQTVQFQELKTISQLFGQSFEKVEFINSDMAPVYIKYCKECFPQAMLTADKFHVIKQVYEAMQAVRIRLKNQELLKLPAKGKKGGNDELKSDEEIKTTETKIEMLTRCKYLLFKSQDQWKTWQQERAKRLFMLFPELERAYLLVQKLKDWYDRKNIGKSFLSIEKNLLQWVEDVECSNIIEMQGLVKLFEKHQDIIINYCFSGQTNAQAENINSRIQRFINVNYGVRDENFFFFRLKKYYS